MSQKNLGITLSNDKAREQFLDDYTNEKHGWYLFAEAPTVQRRWWRRDFDGWSAVIEEADYRSRFPHDGAMVKNVTRVYLVENWDTPLENSVSYITRIRARLKEATVNGNTV